MKIRKEEGATLNELLTNGVLLSAKAIGLYAVLLKADKNKNYTGIKEFLQKHVEDGQMSITSGLQELINKGFLIKTVSRTQSGAFCGTEYVLTAPKREK